MLQSLINKNYPENLFSEFGLTIIDEVHHISSQTFSNSLFKVFILISFSFLIY
jgi:superfamily II DNA or RNA helicase